MAFLSIRNAVKHYAGVEALAEVSFDIAAGEVRALMGENGAGKSTLIKILAGVETADSCDLTIDGAAVRIADAQDAHDQGFRFLHQELNIVPTLSVAENIGLGEAFPTRFGAVDWRALNRQAAAALARLRVDHIDVASKAGRLATGDQMLVRIASMLVGGAGESARLYVMDEPTAALTGVEAETLFQVIGELKRAGAAVLYVSHRIDEVMRICDRVTVLRDGRHVATKAVGDTDKAEVIRLMTGRDVAETFPPRQTSVGDDVVCAARGAATRTVRGLDFTLRAGEILGVAGLANSGQSEVLRAVLGADRLVAGRIEPGSNGPATAWAAHVAYVPKERRREGLMLRRSIRDNTVLPHLARLSRGGVVADRGRETRQTEALATQVRLKSDGVAQACYQLSGGNQQKVVFARALGAVPRLLLLDEPTRGVDVGAKFDIYRLVRALSADGCAVILTSSDLPEVLGMCDRVLILHAGAQRAVVDAAGLDSAGLLQRIYGAAA